MQTNIDLNTRNYTSGLYWQKSRIDGTKTVPVILSLMDGIMTLTAVEGVVFSGSLTSMTIAFGAPLGNPNLSLRTSDGKLYILVTIPTALSPGFTVEQISQLQNHQLSVNYIQAGYDVFKNWQMVLKNNGARFTVKGVALGVASAILVTIAIAAFVSYLVIKFE